jgi:hypothetical protein
VPADKGERVQEPAAEEQPANMHELGQRLQGLSDVEAETVGRVLERAFVMPNREPAFIDLGDALEAGLGGTLSNDLCLSLLNLTAETAADQIDWSDFPNAQTLLDLWRRRYGYRVRELARIFSEGPNEWFRVGIEPLTSSVMPHIRVKLELETLSGKTLLIEALPSSYVNLVSALLKRVADFPESHIEAIDRRAIDRLTEAWNSAQRVITDKSSEAKSQ